MKKTLSLLILIFCTITITACTEDHPPATKINDCYYQVGEHVEYWREWYDSIWKEDKITKLKLENSDPATFEPINYPYSSTCYAKDKNQVYTNRLPIEGADPETFSFLGEFYARDKDHIFHAHKMLPNADKESFEVFEYKIRGEKFANTVVDAKDKNVLYNNGREKKFSSKVDISTFKPINKYFFRDANNIYRGEDPGKPIDENLFLIGQVDINSFELLVDEPSINTKEISYGFSNTYYAKDKISVFLNAYGKKFTVFVPEDLATFTVLNARYSKDAKKVYHYGKILEGADAESFEADEDHWGKDINGRWTPIGKLER